MAATAAAAAACVLADIQYSVALRGWVAEVTVRQRFCNAGDAPLEAEYACPLDPRAALTGLALSVGGRSVRAVSRRVADAEDAYDDAVAAGRRGVMAAPGARAGELRLTLGVVQPRDDVLVTLTYLTRLTVDSSDAAAGTTTYAMAVPLTSLPRCGGAGGGAAKGGAGASLTPAAAAAEAAYNVSVRVSLGAGVASAASPSHGVRFEEGATTTFVPERDLIIQCTSTSTSTGTGVVVAATRDDAAPPAMRYAVALRVAEAAAALRRPAEEAECGGGGGGVVVLVDAGEDEHTAAEARRFATELVRALPRAAVTTVDAAAAAADSLEALLRLPSADAVAHAGRLRAAPHATDSAFARALAAVAAAGCDAVVVTAAAAPMLATREACAAARGFAAAGGGGVHIVGVGPTVNRAAVEEVAAAAVEGGGCGGGSVSYVSANEAVRAKVRRIAEAAGRRPTAVVGAGLEVEEVGEGSAAVVLAFAPEGTEHAEVACGGWSEGFALDEAVARCGGGDVALHALVAAARVRRLEGAGRMHEAAEAAASFGLPSRGTALVAVDTAVVAGSQFGVQLETVPVPRPAGLAQKHVPSAAGARVDPRACDTRARAVGVLFEKADAPEEPSVGTASYDGDDSRTAASESASSVGTSGVPSPVHEGRVPVAEVSHAACQHTQTHPCTQVAKEALRAPLALSQKLYKTLSSNGSQATQPSRQLEDEGDDEGGGVSDQQPDAQQQRVQQLDPDRPSQQQQSQDQRFQQLGPDRHEQHPQQQQQQQSQDQRLQPVGLDPQSQLQQPQPPEEQRFQQLEQQQIQGQRLQQLDPDPQSRFQQSQTQRLQQLAPDRPSQLVQQQQFQDHRFQQLGLDPQSQQQQSQDQRLQQLDPDPQSQFQQLSQDQRLQQLDPDPQSQFQQQSQDQRLQQLDPDPQSRFQQSQTQRLQQLAPDRPSQLVQQQQFQDHRFQQLGLDPQSQQQQSQDQRLQQLDPDPQSQFQQLSQDQRFPQLGLAQQSHQPQFQDQRLQQLDPDPQSSTQQYQTQAVLQPETQEYEVSDVVEEAEEALGSLSFQLVQEDSLSQSAQHRPSASARPVIQTTAFSKTATPQKAKKATGKPDRGGDAPARRSERRSEVIREATGPQQRVRRSGGGGEGAGAAVQPDGAVAPGAAPPAPASAPVPPAEAKKVLAPKKKVKKGKASDEQPRATLSSRLRASLGFGGSKAQPAGDAEDGEADNRQDGGGGGGFLRSKGQTASRSAFSEAVHVCDEVRSALARLQKNKQSAEAWYDLAMLLDEGGTVTIDGRTMTKAAILAKAISLAPYDSKIYLALCDCITPGESAVMEDGTLMTERELRSLGAAVMQTC